MEEAFEGKSLEYAELAADTEQHGWKAKVCPVEVGCRGFMGKSFTRLLKDMGMQAFNPPPPHTHHHNSHWETARKAPSEKSNTMSPTWKPSDGGIVHNHISSV